MTVAARPKVAEVLLAENAAAEGGLSLHALRESDPQINLNIVRDGPEAIAFLDRRGAYGDAPRPSLVLLDLELAGGGEVLAKIKSDPELRRIPVVAFSVSGSVDDLRTAYRLSANCYIAKPEDASRFSYLVERIKEFWLTRVRLPAD